MEKVSGYLATDRVRILTGTYRRSPTMIWASVCLTNVSDVYHFTVRGGVAACRRQLMP